MDFYNYVKLRANELILPCGVLMALPTCFPRPVRRERVRERESERE